MSDQLKEQFLAALAGVVLLLFAGAWIWIGFKVLFFTSSTATPTLTFSEAQATVAGFLAAAVGAGTASVLGIEIQKIKQADALNQKSRSIAVQVGDAATSSWLLVVGIGLYALVGCFVLIVWFFDSDIAPEMVSAFALGVLGWLAGAFAAVFRTKST